MNYYFYIHNENPQIRLIKRTAKILTDGGVIVYPTDSTYAISCLPGEKDAIERICRIRNLTVKHHFTLMCRNLKEVSRFAWFDRVQFKILKSNTPGPYTFILKATKEVPNRLVHKRKKTIGIRIPDFKIVHAILEEINNPLITTTLILPGDKEPLYDPLEIKEKVGKQVDVILDSGIIIGSVTTMVDLTSDVPIILREGSGEFNII